MHVLIVECVYVCVGALVFNVCTMACRNSVLMSLSVVGVFVLCVLAVNSLLPHKVTTVH